MTDDTLEFFKTDDADCSNHMTIENGYIKGRTHSISIEEANRLLRELGKVVYANDTGPGKIRRWEDVPSEVDTHTALLINIQSSKEESAEDILKEIVDYSFAPNGDSFNKYFKALEKAKAFLDKTKRGSE